MHAFGCQSAVEEEGPFSIKGCKWEAYGNKQVLLLHVSINRPWREREIVCVRERERECVCGGNGRSENRGVFCLYEL